MLRSVMGATQQRMRHKEIALNSESWCVADSFYTTDVEKIPGSSKYWYY